MFRAKSSELFGRGAIGQGEVLVEHLKPLVTVKNVHTVIDGIINGIVTLNSVWRESAVIHADYIAGQPVVTRGWSIM